MSVPAAAKPAKAIIAISSLALAAACASPAPPKPYYSTRTYQANAYAQVAIVQCLIGKHVIPQSDVSGQSWYSNGTVQSNADFASWFTAHGMQVYGGKKLVDWVDQARHGWPTSYCGPSPAPTASAGS